MVVGFVRIVSCPAKAQKQDNTAESYQVTHLVNNILCDGHVPDRD